MELVTGSNISTLHYNGTGELGLEIASVEQACKIYQQKVQVSIVLIQTYAILL